MKSFDELRLEQLTQDIENRKKKWIALSEKLRFSGDPVEKVDLEERKRALEHEIESLMRQQDELKARVQPSGPGGQSAENPTEKVRIFLSYASEDSERVRVIYDRLLAAGYSPWLDREHLLAGQNWELAIKKALKESDFVLVCLSATSINKRSFLQKEIKQALEHAQEKLEDDVWLIPARLDDCPIPDSLSTLQWVDLFQPTGFDRLIAAIEFQLKKPGKAIPTP